MTPSKKDRLGKGLGALLGDYFAEEAGGEGQIRKLPVGALVPNPFQPRREFPEDELEELTASIKENGLLQPLVVRRSAGRFELVAGERRLRAIRRLGWEEVPAVVREVDDRTLLVLALVENLQREALGPLEEAEGYRVLSEDFDLTQAEIAESVGKSRSTVANTLRLLQLPPSVRKLLEEGGLSMGHARALLALEDGVRAGELARRAAKESWSVREVEKRVRAAVAGSDEGQRSPRRSAATPSRNPVVRALEEELRVALATRVRLRGAEKGEGMIEIPFHSNEDFERIFALLAGREASEVVG